MPPTVVIDPGHGGSSAVGGSSPNNAVGPNGLHEKDVTLDLAHRVAALLTPQATVVLTRTGDDNHSLADRAHAARERDADVFVSIHLNGWRDPSVDGSEAWVACEAGPASRALARTLLDRVLTVTRAPDRGVHVDDLGVLLPERLGAGTAATLVEVAFLTNPEEATRLADDGYRQALARAIAAGIEALLPHAPAARSSGTEDRAVRSAACPPSALKLALTPAPAYARPLYASGEHVQSGGDLYPDQLYVGRPPGVAFSYGELIAMGDLYASVELMMGADPDELTRLKELIDRSTRFYRVGHPDRSAKVTDEDWKTATGGRYLQLAEDNYEHFSPNTMFTDAVAAAATTRGTNRSTWEAYHRQAIEEAQKLAADPANANRSYLPMWPLIVNAFGDHFLTDAFAAGHLINKEVMIAYFHANFFSGDSVNDAGEEFFGRVAELAFVGEVRDRFSDLETADPRPCAWGWCLSWHPNIDTTHAFKKFLIQAAEQEREKVANFVVLALHDRLNREGLYVTNGAGDPVWLLTGDAHLNEKSLGIMRKAVQQSVDNVNDPTILDPEFDIGPFYARVWRYVPRLTPSSEAQLKGLVHEYTDPASERLVAEAAGIIHDELKSIIDTAIADGKLRPA